MTYSSQQDVDTALARLRKTFQSGKTRDKNWRKQQLKKAWWMLEDHKDEIEKALFQDLHKHAHESLSSDYAAVQADILHTLAKIDSWTADLRPARSNMLNFLGGATVRKEPLGVALIVGAWNYPFVLLLQPMIAAIAAGCAILLKPSDVAVASQNLLMRIIPKYLDNDAIACVTAGPQEMGYILSQRFDQIFYTGSTNVAKIVAAAAAKNLTPVVLELGGQGPAIVCRSADIELAAKRIAATKFMNAGQICLNVNHVFVDPAVHDKLISALRRYFDLYMGNSKGGPSYYTHIVSTRHFDRLDKVLQGTKGTIVYGGDRDRASLFFGPTIVDGVSLSDSVLSEELFGPILPIITADLDTAIRTTKSFEHPLVLYGFTTDANDKRRILDETTSGGVTFNDCIMHVGASDAPFGGVGHAGMGYYHGEYGVNAFSYLRTYIELPGFLDRVMGFRYPPYTARKTKQMVRSTRAWFDRDGNDRSNIGFTTFVLLGALAVGIAYWATAAAS
ncbi:hypothetical protein BDV12DRAFT_180251 [Aspergillus spectabilis]